MSTTSSSVRWWTSLLRTDGTTQQDKHLSREAVMCQSLSFSTQTFKPLTTEAVGTSYLCGVLIVTVMLLSG